MNIRATVCLRRFTYVRYAIAVATTLGTVLVTRARGVTVQVEVADALPPLPVDRVQIQQVPLNLIINGAEAMESTLPLERRIEIRVGLAGAEIEPAVLLRIRDHGPGVNGADADRLFAPFYSTKSQGLGLGLPISRSIIEAHGGRLSLATTEGAGATFEILLPLRDEATV